MSNRTSKADKAIAAKWEVEKALVKEGKGTRDWTPEQQKSILEKGKAYDDNGKAFEGQHMKSVEAYPEFQSDPNNIQFLTRDEHLDAHKGSWQNPTNGYYDPNTGTMHEFTDESVEPAPIIDLTEPYASSETAEQTNDDYMGTAGTGTTVSSEVIDEAENINAASNTEQSQEKSNNSEEYMGSVGNISDNTQENNGPSEENSSGEDMEE